MYLYIGTVAFFALSRVLSHNFIFMSNIIPRCFAQSSKGIPVSYNEIGSTDGILYILMNRSNSVLFGFTSRSLSSLDFAIVMRASLKDVAECIRKLLSNCVCNNLDTKLL